MKLIHKRLMLLCYCGSLLFRRLWLSNQINVKEYRKGIQKRTIQRNWQHGYTRRRKIKQKRSTICVGHHYAQSNTNNVNKTSTLLQTTGGKDEPNIVFMWKT